MSWRPEGWESEIRKLLEKMPLSNSTEGKLFGMNCFKAGADAMLEAIEKKIDDGDGDHRECGDCHFLDDEEAK